MKHQTSNRDNGDNLTEFDPKIIGYLCNWCHSAFFFEAKSFTGSGSQRKTWGKKKLALTCSNFAWRCDNA